MAKNVINVKILADNRGLKTALDDSHSKIGSFAKNAGKAFLAIGVAAGAAAAAFAVKGVQAFAQFETQMNEVFTLLPGITEDAMAAMEESVKDFSKEFGVLPEETIPALYQALSAGVPEDNVFEFLETAQMAARGGVTDLTTAVDGITSVVNAYGEEVISAAEASDFMFTAVRLGKTTFEELSASLSNVTPIASALGVGMDEVSAAIAVMTAQGVPTAQATTQIKSALAELAKEGSIADVAFQDLAGQGFTDFIAGGGSMGEAFAMISQAAEDSGGSVVDMFGSIEAGQAVMALTAGDSEAFNSAMAEMQNSAGATEEAYDQMNTGLSVAFDKLKATFAVLLIEIGEKLAPVVQRVADWFVENSDRIADGFDTAMRIVEGVVASVVAFFVKAWPIAQKAIEAVADFIVEDAWPVMQDVFENVQEAVGEVVDFFVANWPSVQDAVGEVVDFFVANLPKAQEAVETAFEWIKENWTLIVGAFAGISVVVMAQLIPALIAKTVALWNAVAAWVALNAPIILIVAAFAAVGAALVWAYQNVEEFRVAVDAVVAWLVNTAWPFIQMVAEGIVVAFQAVVAWVQEVWPTVQQVLADFVAWLQEYVLPVVEAWVAFLIQYYTILWEAIQTAFDIIVGIIETAIDVITVIWEAFGETILSYIQGVWDGITELIEAALDIITGIIDTVTSLISGDWEGVWQGIQDTAQGIWDGIVALIDLAINAIGTTIGLVLDGIQLAWETVWQVVSDFVSDRWDDITGFVSGGISDLVGFVTELPGQISSAVAGAFDSIWDGFRGVINNIIRAWNNLSLGPWTLGGGSFLGAELPSVTLGPFSTPDIPTLAMGGLVDRATLAVVGEAGPELVLPLTRPARANELLTDHGFMANHDTPHTVPVIINLMDRHQVEAVVSQRDADLLMSLEAGMR